MSIKQVDLALTTAGQALKAKIEAGYGTIALEITRIVTASGTSEDPLNLTDVVDQKQEFAITGRSTKDARTTISAVLTNAELSTGYTLAQIGFYAMDPDAGEILYRISQFAAPNYVPASTERGWTYQPQFNIFTGNAKDVVVSIDPTGIATLDSIYKSVEFSRSKFPAVGVRTHYYSIKDVPGYTPFDPNPDIPGVEDGVLETAEGKSRGFVNLNPGLQPMAVMVD